MVSGQLLWTYWRRISWQNSLYVLELKRDYNHELTEPHGKSMLDNSASSTEHHMRNEHAGCDVKRALSKFKRVAILRGSCRTWEIITYISHFTDVGSIIYKERESYRIKIPYNADQAVYGLYTLWRAKSFPITYFVYYTNYMSSLSRVCLSLNNQLPTVLHIQLKVSS